MPISTIGQGSTRGTEGKENGKNYKNGRQPTFLFGEKEKDNASQRPLEQKELLQASGSKLSVAEAGQVAEEDPPLQGPSPGVMRTLDSPAGVPPARWVGFAKDSKPTVENEPVVELAGLVQGEPVKILVDSGSTGNFIAADLAHSLN